MRKNRLTLSVLAMTVLFMALPLAVQAAEPGTAASAYLQSLDQRSCEKARLEVELPGTATEPQLELAGQAAAEWNDGRRDEAVELLRQLESAGMAPAVGISWGTALPSGGSDRASDSRVGDPKVGAYRMALDYHDAADRLFALLLWDSGWTVNISHDGGDSWSETYEWYSSYGCFDADGVVADDYFYVGYVHNYTQDLGTLRRFNEADGSSDSTYNYQNVVSVSPNTIRDVALASNASGYDNDIYYVAALNIGEVVFIQGYPSTGDGWVDYGNTTDDFSGGLDACVNANPVHDTPMFSYITTGGQVKIKRWDSAWYSLMVEYAYTGYVFRPRTAVSAYGNTTICAYGHAFDHGYGVRYGVNLDGGFTFQRAALSEPAAGEYDSWLADISLRSGAGVGAVYLKETGGGNADVWFRCHPGISVPPMGIGAWEAPVKVNEHDSYPTERPVISWIPRTAVSDPDAWAFGMLYLSDDIDAIPYFDRKDGVPENGGDCTDPITIEGYSLPFSDTNSTLGQGDDYFDTCMGAFDDGQDVLYCLQLYQERRLTITLDAATGWGGVAIFDGCPDDPGTTCLAHTTSVSSPDVIEKLWLDTGTYYIMVDSWPPPETFSYTLTVEEDLPGDDCTDPQYLTFPDYSFLYDYNSTCGRGNTYSNTCMGEYDGGEDIIYELTVTEDTCVDILLSSDDNYGAIAVFDSCPADDPGACIAVASGSAEDKWIEGLELATGTYWIMIDSWPDPWCHDFLLHISGCFEVSCPSGATDEGEPCGEELNDGCSMDMPAFRAIANGETVCGTIAATPGLLDFDWYQVELDEPTPLTFVIESELPLVAGLMEVDPPGSGDCADIVGTQTYIQVSPMIPESLTTPELPAGTHWLYVRSFFTNGHPCGFHSDYTITLTWPWSGNTIDASLTCTPDSGTVPFQTMMTVEMTNLYPEQVRQVAGQIIAELANGSTYPNWRAGFTNLQPGETYTASWQQYIPALGSVIGDNDFSLFAEDITPPPYNQPPYTPSGDTDTGFCMVTAAEP